MMSQLSPSLTISTSFVLTMEDLFRCNCCYFCSFFCLSSPVLRSMVYVFCPLKSGNSVYETFLKSELYGMTAAPT